MELQVCLYKVAKEWTSWTLTEPFRPWAGTVWAQFGFDQHTPAAGARPADVCAWGHAYFFKHWRKKRRSKVQPGSSALYTGWLLLPVLPHLCAFLPPPASLSLSDLSGVLTSN